VDFDGSRGMALLPSLAEADEEEESQHMKHVVERALDLACKGDLSGLVAWLRGHGGLAPDSVTRADGWTIAHSAAQSGSCDVLRYAVHYSEPRADSSGRIVGGGSISPTARTCHGWSPVHIAAAHGHPEAVALLGELGADLEVEDKSGARPLHSAAASGHANVVRVLAASGVSLDAVTMDGATAAYVAAGNGCDGVVRLLGELGADMNLATTDGWTPAQIAHEMGHTKVLHALSELVVGSLRASSPACVVRGAHGAAGSTPGRPVEGRQGDRILLDTLFEEDDLGMVLSPLGPRGDEAMVSELPVLVCSCSHFLPLLSR
jgi:hypothetical protein